MPRLLLRIMLIWSAWVSVLAADCDTWLTPLNYVCNNLKQIKDLGADELYIPAYAWHNRYTYSREKIRQYNEAAVGIGYGRGLYTERGNWQGLYAMAFLDSHSQIEPIVGYSYLQVLPINNDWRIGGGYTVFITSRSDIFNRFPFPGILPWVSVIFKKVALSATYIPGSAGAGNVLFVAGKVTL